jgi:class 3 adenylate cyclase/tetratricopeptide (TPR) repeat protein
METPEAEQEQAQVERRIVSVLFADLVGFTSLSERLEPEDMSTMQDAYFASVRETVGRYGGRLEKFIGDAAMAVFGLPKTRDDDAERAVRTGLALVGAIEQVGARLGFAPDDLRLRVGVTTGQVVHAESGPDAGRVTGDTINTAARFQTAAAPNTVLIGEKTALAVAGAIDLEEMGELELKGKAAPVKAWRAVGIRAEASRDHALGRLRAPILGRDHELATLARWLAVAEPGRGTRGLIVAPPGVGKTRLVEEFVARARNVDAKTTMDTAPAVLRARLSADRIAPYEGVAQLLVAALGIRGIAYGETSAPHGARMTALRSVLSGSGIPSSRAQVLAEEITALVWPSTEGEAPAHSGVSGEREARFAAWMEGLDALSGNRSAVWVVEDVHWAGGDLLAFLVYAAAQPVPSGRLVLATTRPSLLEYAPAWGESNDDAGQFVLELQPLAAPEAGALVRALVGDALSEQLMDAIVTRSDGNPLFIEELLRTWISVGTLAASEDGGWRLTTPATDVPLPATVQAMYSAQIDDLAPAARLAARRGAVAGRRFPFAALDPLGVPEAEAAVEVLRQRAMVAGPFDDSLLGAGYAYRHALLRDAGYASLALSERARLHVRLARWLEAVAGERSGEIAEVIANHYSAALESAPTLQQEIAEGLDRATATREAARWFERAAEAALAMAAHDAARALYRRALRLIPDDAVPDRARLLERLGSATAFASDMDEGGHALEESLRLYRSLFAEARGGLAKTLSSLGLVWNQQLRFKDASRLAEDGLETIRPGDDLETARLFYLRGWSSLMFEIQPETRQDFERALELARTHGDRMLELEAADAVYNMRIEEGEVTLDELLEQNQRVIALAQELGNWQRVTHTLRFEAAMLTDDRAGDAWPRLEAAAELAEAHGLREEAAWIDYVRTEAGFLGGDWDLAMEAGLRAIDVAERNAYHRVAVRTWFALIAIAVARGRRDVLGHADRWFDEHEAIFPDSPFRRLMHTGIDLRLTAAGFRNFEAPPAEELLPVWNETQGLPSVWDAADTVAQAWLDRGDIAAVRLWLEAMAKWHAHPMTSRLGRGVHGLIAARLATSENHPEEASRGAERALDAFRGIRAPWWMAKAIRLLGSADAADTQTLKEAEEIERSLGIAKG